MWETIFAVAANVIGGAMQSSAAKKAGQAQAASADQATALQKQIYTDQRGLLGPGYMTGGAATNKLAALFGIAPQNYEAAYAGGLGGGGVQAGRFASYLNANPDVMEYWQNNPAVQQQFPNVNDLAKWHWENIGQQEGRQLPTGASTTPSTQTPTNPLADFYDSPYAKLATTLSTDQMDKIRGQLGAAGKSISGAAEGRYAKTLAGNTYGAFTDYTNQLSNLAGMGQTNSQLASNAAGQYGVNAGNLITQAGNAKANALSSGYAAMNQGISGALSTLNDYGKQQKWWS